MLVEIILVWSGIVLIGALGALGIRGRRRAPAAAQTVEDWPTTERNLRQVAAQMRVQRVIADAKLILYHQYRGSTGSRRQMKASNMSETRWGNAIGLLRDLGIYALDGNTPRMSHYHATRRIDHYERIETPIQVARAASETYVTPR